MITNFDHNYLSPEDYLATERIAKDKHEYIRGQTYAMAGASKAHGMIIINLATLLKNRLRGSGCLVYGTDMKVRLEIANSYFYPDLVVTCDSRDNQSFSEDFIRYPRLIVEVLSPTTAAFARNALAKRDRGDKFADYRSFETLEEYVLISQERIGVDCFRRNDEGFWVLYPYSKGADIYLASIDFHCAIASLYEDITEIC
ncbi:Uma2 family endonuclease [Microcystis aeruginosa EAWAG127a]|uniref:Uma2 family endonuclease n=1 Tax=Microcystis aeruginosa EAWAG127a TaxID=2529855 RepID=A0A5J5LUH7_MICAE|nr:Uma2 family endonuclease [Microcystis aeruginosa]KAB0241312.1 Uma2 family endonuclease [Microcystis aeruginosa EAWAG127a]